MRVQGMDLAMELSPDAGEEAHPIIMAQHQWLSQAARPPNMDSYEAILALDKYQEKVSEQNQVDAGNRVDMRRSTMVKSLSAHSSRCGGGLPALVVVRKKMGQAKTFAQVSHRAREPQRLCRSKSIPATPPRLDTS